LISILPLPRTLSVFIFSILSISSLLALSPKGAGSNRISGQAEERTPQSITLRSKLVTVAYHRATGTIDIAWRSGPRLLAITSGAQLANGLVLSTAVYSTHILEGAAADRSGDSDHSVREYTIRSTGAGLPDFFQHIWISDDRPSISMQAELGPEASAIGTRHFDAVVLNGAKCLQLASGAALRVLHVPFDNDMWFRYISWPVADMKADQKYSSNEVTAIYDNASRNSFIFGSITHDLWKTAIDTDVEGGAVTKLDIYGGISSPTGVRTDTHDTVPHGIVQGSRVVSPRIFIGSYTDWRDGLEAYGAANAAVQPPLVWAAGAPMGWNSWAAYGAKINNQRYLGSAAFVRDVLVPQGFGRDHVVYVNLDAFWSNLDAVQLADAVRTIKEMHSSDGIRFEPGIYWTPFAYWSDDLDAYVEGTGMKYRYRDILLKAPDGSLLPKVDGGRAIDASHPGSKIRIDYFLKQFQDLGFRYLKLDFLSHGSLEGRHFDPAVQTGIQAYNLGMEEVVKAAANRMFLSLSIAPLFPAGYGHARRLSCDTKGHISGGDQSTEYMLNSLTYGWWTANNLYIADPDHVVLGEAADQGARSVTEGVSRLLSAIVSGGMILDSSRLADDAQARELAKEVYANRKLFAVASEGHVFRPIEGDTGEKAAEAFMRPSANGFYLAVFNYDSQNPRTIRVPMERISSALAGVAVKVIDVASGAALKAERGTIAIDLAPAESKLVELRRN
jgi:alpha-galactosidase